MNKAVYIYHDYMDTIFSELADEEIGKLVRAIMALAINGEITEFDDRTVRTAYKRWAMDCERNNIRYEQTCERNRNNANKRWHKDEVEIDTPEDDMPPDAIGCDRIKSYAKNANKKKNKEEEKKEKNNKSKRLPQLLLTDEGRFCSLEESDANIRSCISIMKVNGEI